MHPGRAAHLPIRDRWYDLLERFPTATPELIAERRLNVRSDTKFLVAPEAALGLLHGLWPGYAMVPAPMHPLGSYHTLYFDTADLELFHRHRRGGRIRHKVRIRHYLDRKVSALEVKTRVNEMRTVKRARDRAYRDDHLSHEDRAFIVRHTGLTAPVIPQVWTRYRRLTLFGLDHNERLTVDLDLQVDMDGRSRRFESLAVIEVKQWPFHRTTPVMTALRALGSSKGWASKYCLGIAHTHPHARLAGLGRALRAFERSAA